MTDQQLLERFVRTGDEGAFSALARRHTDWLYSVCRRRLNDAAKAEDATQAVLIALARKAPRLVHHVSLMGWLYQAARIAAADIQRIEQRRLRLEAEVAKMNTNRTTDGTRQQWEQIELHLEACLDQLSEKDRLAILLRFYEKQSHGRIGAVLGISPAAAEKRVSRAMDRLKGILERRVGAVGGVGLGAVLASHAVSPAPKSLLAAVCKAAMLHSGHLTPAIKGVLVASSAFKSKLIVGSVAACVLVGVPLAIVLSAGSFSGDSAVGRRTGASNVASVIAAPVATKHAGLSLAWNEQNVPKLVPTASASDELAVQATGTSRAGLTLSVFDRQPVARHESLPTEIPAVEPGRLALTLGWNGQRVVVPQPPVVPLTLQGTPVFQQWLKVGNPQTFEHPGTDGGRYLVQVAGVAEGPDGHPMALVPRIARFRADGSLAATAQTVPADIPGWNILSSDGRSPLCAVTQWTTYAEDGVTPRLTLSTSRLVPGMPAYLQTVTIHEPDGGYRKYTANSRGVVFRELSFDAQGALRGVVHAALQFSEGPALDRPAL